VRQWLGALGAHAAHRLLTPLPRGDLFIDRSAPLLVDVAAELLVLNGKPASQVAVRCLVPHLLDVGFTGVLQLQLKSTMSDWLLKALAEHLRVGHAAAAELGKAVTLAELELPLGAGPDVTVGKGDQQATLTPLVAEHPKTVTREYLETNYRPDNRSLFEELWPSWWPGPKSTRRRHVTRLHGRPARRRTTSICPSRMRWS
jgi:hypothetical protein